MDNYCNGPKYNVTAMALCESQVYMVHAIPIYGLCALPRTTSQSDTKFRIPWQYNG